MTFPSYGGRKDVTAGPADKKTAPRLTPYGDRNAEGFPLRGVVMKAATSPNSAVLTCWKDIAGHFGKGVRTVQRWERQLGLPVRRPAGIDHKSAVVAYTRDLDQWLQSRWSRRSLEQNPKPGQPSIERRMFSDISNGLRLSRELRLELRTLRTEHRDLMDQLGLSLTALRQTCRESPWQPDTPLSSSQQSPMNAA